MAVDQAALQQQLQDSFGLQTQGQVLTGGAMGGNPGGAYNQPQTGVPQVPAGRYPLPGDVSYYDNSQGYRPPTMDGYGNWMIPAAPATTGGFSDEIRALLAQTPVRTNPAIQPWTPPGGYSGGPTGPIGWGTPQFPPGTPPGIPGGPTAPPMSTPQPPGQTGNPLGVGGGPGAQHPYGSLGNFVGYPAGMGPSGPAAGGSQGSLTSGPGMSMPSWMQGGNLQLGNLGKWISTAMPSVARSLGINPDGSIAWQQIADLYIPGNAYLSNTGKWDASNVIAQVIGQYTGLPINRLMMMAGKTQANQDDDQNFIEKALVDHYMDNMRNQWAENPTVKVELGRYASGELSTAPGVDNPFNPAWNGTGGTSVGGAGSQWGSGWGGTSFGGGQGPTGNGYGSGFGSGSSFGSFGSGWGGAAPGTGGGATNPDWGPFTPQLPDMTTGPADASGAGDAGAGGPVVQTPQGPMQQTPSGALRPIGGTVNFTGGAGGYNNGVGAGTGFGASNYWNNPSGFGETAAGFGIGYGASSTSSDYAKEGMTAPREHWV